MSGWINAIGMPVLIPGALAVYALIAGAIAGVNAARDWLHRRRIVKVRRQGPVQ